MIKSRLLYLIAERESKEGRSLPIKRLARETGLAESTLYNLAHNTTQRFDGSVLSTLCRYFAVTLDQLLIYDAEGATTKMAYRIPDTSKEASDNLIQFFEEIIADMDPEFTSHQFILRLAQRHQAEYVGALARSLLDGSSAPFQVVHGYIARKLGGFSPLVELAARDVPSPDIFGNDSSCALWRKK